MEEIDPTEKHMGRTEMVHMGRANGNGFRRDWIGEREVKVNPQRQNGGQSILPNLFYAEIKIELHGES